ncbi:MAG: DUF2796 domain-containing protein [Chloroflexota bacterium]
MFRFWLLVCLLLIFVSACSPTVSEVTETQPGGSEETSNGEHDGEHDDEHDDEHNNDEHENERREHGAHEHGVAFLTIAWSGNELAIDLETPAFNVLGFEYAPTSEEEKALLAESVAVLEAGALLQLSPGADCTVTSAAVETELGEKVAEGETHSDIDVAYTVQCQNPDNLEILDASDLFARFPNFAELDVQWVSDTQQSATELTAANSIVSLR